MIFRKLKENDQLLLKDGSVVYYNSHTSKDMINVDYFSHHNESGLPLYDQCEIPLSMARKIIGRN